MVAHSAHRTVHLVQNEGPVKSVNVGFYTEPESTSGRPWAKFVFTEQAKNVRRI